MRVVSHISDFLFPGLFLLILILGVASCETENCVSLANNDLLVSFYEPDSTTLKNVMFDYVRAAGNDSLFYDSNTVSSKYRFPVNPAADETLFIMQVIDTVTYDTISYDPVVVEPRYHLRDRVDSLWVEYQRSQRVITVECGVEIYYSHLSIKKCTFNGYEFEDDKTSLSRMNDVNIKIYD